MSPKRVAATAGRIFRQLKRDPRTIALMLVVPVMVLVILRFVFADALELYDAFAPMMIGIMTFIVMFVISSIATLRERQSGTLERLLISPMTRLDVILGYALAFGSTSLLQSGIVTAVVIGAFEVAIAANFTSVLLVAVLSGLVGMSFGLFLSGFASSEFQAVQFMPAFVLPQIFLVGIFIPRDQMARGLEIASNILPLTYVVEAMQELTMHANWTSELSVSIMVLVGFGLGSLLLASMTMRRVQK